MEFWPEWGEILPFLVTMVAGVACFFASLRWYVVPIARSESHRAVESLHQKLRDNDFAHIDQKLDLTRADLTTRMDRMDARHAKDIGELKTDVKVLTDDVGELKTDVRVLQTDVRVLKTDVRVLKTDVREMKTDMRHLHGGMEALNRSMAGVVEMLGRGLPSAAAPDGRQAELGQP